MTDWRIEGLGRAIPAKRRRRWHDIPPQPLDLLPADWKALAARWLKRGSQESRWDSLAADAGPAHYILAQQVLKWLTDNGWAALVEEQRHGDWWPTRVQFRHTDKLRAGLGLPDPAAATRRLDELRGQLDTAAHPDLATVLADLDGLPAYRALPRLELLLALARWRTQGRAGSRRDFALAARQATKAISEAEWRWLENCVDLAAFGIERHTPLLLIAAPLRLNLPAGDLCLAACPDFAALSPASIAEIQAVHALPSRWRLLENRTSFERLARARDPETAVAWLPGFPPGWWRRAMATLLALAPAPAEIACDPDPAGIHIALEAAKVWEAAQLPWQPWRMEATRLAALPARRPLTADDRAMLDRLPSDLPSMLAELAQWMRQQGEKGEQEAYL